MAAPARCPADRASPRWPAGFGRLLYGRGARPGSQRGDHVGPSPVDRARPGSKHHLIVDRHRPPLAVTLTGGNRHDITQLLPLLAVCALSASVRARPGPWCTGLSHWPPVRARHGVRGASPLQLLTGCLCPSGRAGRGRPPRWASSGRCQCPELRSSRPAGRVRSRLASNSGQAGTARLAPFVLGTGAGLFRMEGRHQGVLHPLTGVAGGIARKIGNFHPEPCQAAAFVRRNGHLRAFAEHSKTRNVP